MGRKWRGTLAVEGVQTGDGRLLVEGSVTWVDPPLPLAWLQEEQHGDLLAGGVQVGTIDAITREGANIVGEGTIDDAIPEGAEVVRRMTEGTAPLGARFGVSIDPDDYAVELVANGDAADELVIVSSAAPIHGLFAACQECDEALTAAAGEGEPQDGAVLFEDAADAVLQRYTRLRIRGATLCAVAAFSDAYVELADDAAPAESAAPQPVAAGATFVDAVGGRWNIRNNQLGYAGRSFNLVRSDPMAEWFGRDAEPEQVVPIEIESQGRFGGRIRGYTALWGTCHIGRPGECVTPPSSPSGYRFFHTGATRLAGKDVPTGRITMGIGHAPLDLEYAAAAAHYDDTRCFAASVCNHENATGIWFSGTLAKGVTDEQAEALLACGGISGDWRPIGGALEHVAALAVNVPGFPVPRSLTAAATAALADDAATQVRYADDGDLAALVGAGLSAVVRRSALHRSPAPVVPLRSDPDVLRRLAALESLTAPLRAERAAALRAKVRGA